MLLHNEILKTYAELDKELTQMIAEQNEELSIYIPYKDYLFLTSEDSIVFTYSYPKDLYVPSSLSYHFQTVKMIIDARKQIEQIEIQIKEIGDQYSKEFLNSGKVQDIKSLIASSIEKDIYVLTELMQDILARNLSSLSKQQYEYFKPGLTNRYNKFIKFFE